MLGGGEAESAAAEHRGGEAVHHRLGLHVQVAIHFVRLLPTDHTNPVAVDAGAEEGHRSASARGTGGDVRQGVRGVRVEDKGGADTSGEVGGENVPKGCSGCHAHRVQRGGGGGTVLT